MELALSTGFVVLNENEMYSIEGGNDVAYYVGVGVGVVLGIVYDAVLVYRALVTGSWY